MNIPERSGKSFAAKFGRGFLMSELIDAAHKVAGLEHSDIAFSPGYSEENVYKLILTLLEYEQAKTLSELHVVWISNSKKQIQVWCQKDANVEDRNSGFMAKDFHVILVHTPISMDGVCVDPGNVIPSYVWDLDCTLPLPCRLGYYASNVLRSQAYLQFDEQYTRYFRVLPATEYLQHFASDRTHMRLANGQFRRPPPPWPPIKAKDGSDSTIAKFWDLYSPQYPWQQQDATNPYGLVMTENQFLQYFRTPLTA